MENILPIVLQQAVIGLVFFVNLVNVYGSSQTASSTVEIKAPEPEPQPCMTRDCVLKWVNIYSKEYGVDRNLALKVGKCESELRPHVYGDGGKAYGAFQFHEPTFRMFAKQFGDVALDYKNPEHNVKLAIWALANGKGSHWTCYDRSLRSLKR